MCNILFQPTRKLTTSKHRHNVIHCDGATNDSVAALSHPLRTVRSTVFHMTTMHSVSVMGYAPPLDFALIEPHP